MRLYVNDQINFIMGYMLYLDSLKKHKSTFFYERNIFHTTPYSCTANCTLSICTAVQQELSIGILLAQCRDRAGHSTSC